MSISRPIFFKPALWKLTQVDYSSQYFSMRIQRQQIEYEASLLTRIFQMKEMTIGLKDNQVPAQENI